MQNVGSMGWDGTLSPDEFYVAAGALTDRWKQMDYPTLPQWKWIPYRRMINCVSCDKEGYLSMERMQCCKSSEENVLEQGISVEEEPLDSATLILSDDNETHLYDFHIVYSFSYKVPVLYFRGYHSDGQPLNLDGIKKDLPCYSLSILKDSKWTFMTKEEHPYLHRPWYTLHPCGTSEWMRLLFGGARPMKNDTMIVGYLPAWLSVVGQAVGLKIPIELQNMSLQNSSPSCAFNI